MQTKRSLKPGLIRLVTNFLMAIAVIGLAGSAQAAPGDLSGTYVAKNGTVQFTFNPGGKVEMTASGTGVVEQGTYHVENGKIKVIFMQTVGYVMAIDSDGCLEQVIFGKLCKAGTVEGHTGKVETMTGRYDFGAGRVLEFRPDGTTIAHDPSGKNYKGTYVRHGNHVKLIDPGSSRPPLELLVDAKGCLYSNQSSLKVCPQ